MRLRLRCAGDDGTSLPELLVSMLLTSLVLALVGTTFLSGVRTTRVTQQRLDQTGDARVALDTMSNRLRVAVPPVSLPATGSVAFVSAGASSVTFYASLQRGQVGEPRPTRVRYGVDASRRCLLEELTPASGASEPYTYAAADSRLHCLAFGTISSRTKIFTYYADGTATTRLGDDAGTVAAADLCRVRSVRVDLTVAGGTAAAGTSLESRLTLPNIPTSCGAA